MSDIKGQLIKNTYNYVLQSDIYSGIVYRIGGDVPVNPKFISGLTINTSLTYSDGSEIDGYVLTCDANGNATWGPVSASTTSSGVTSVTATNGISGNATTGAIILVNTAPDQTVTISGGTGITTGGTYPNFTLVNSAPDQTVTITGGTNIQILGTYPDFGVNFTGTTGSNFTGGTVSGATNFTNGLTATTISATTYYNYPDTYVTGFSLTNDVITLSQNRTDSYSSFTVTLSGLTGTPQQVAYYNVDGVLTGDTNFTRLDETNNFTTGINTVNFSNVAEHQDTKFDYNVVRDRVFNDDTGLVGETNLGPSGYISTISDTGHNTVSGLDISDISGGFRYQDSGGTYCGFFYNTTNPGWSIVRTGTQYDYNLPQSAYVAGSVLTDVSGDGNLTWVVPTTTSFTGGTVTGPTNFTDGLTANTISATTYLNLPSFTGGTVSGATRFISGLTANTISATTYQNLPTYISAVTESANVITVVNSNGSSTNYTIDAVTGGTYSAGQITLSGTGNVNGTQISTKILPIALIVVSNTASTDASLSSLFTLTLTGNTTLATPTNGFSGQRIVYRLKQDGTGNKLLTLSSGFRSGPITVTLSTTPNTTDYLGIIYNEIDNKWDVLALNKGYS